MGSGGYDGRTDRHRHADRLGCPDRGSQSHRDQPVTDRDDHHRRRWPLYVRVALPRLVHTLGREERLRSNDARRDHRAGGPDAERRDRREGEPPNDRTRYRSLGQRHRAEPGRGQLDRQRHRAARHHRGRVFHLRSAAVGRSRTGRRRLPQSGVLGDRVGPRGLRPAGAKRDLPVRVRARRELHATRLRVRRRPHPARVRSIPLDRAFLAGPAGVAGVHGRGTSRRTVERPRRLREPSHSDRDLSRVRHREPQPRIAGVLSQGAVRVRRRDGQPALLVLRRARGIRSELPLRLPMGRFGVRFHVRHAVQHRRARLRHPQRDDRMLPEPRGCVQRVPDRPARIRDGAVYLRLQR